MCLLFQRKESVVVYMTIDEAIYCLKSYQPDHDRVDMCLDCKYYGSVQVDSRTFTCKSSEARAIAIKALEGQKLARREKISPTNIYSCTNCGRFVMTPDIDVYRWCHGCGAKMEVEHE